MSNDIALAIAREKALMEEEKWLIENLKKIRSQRNALRVEALYFQGLRADLYQMHAVQFAGGIRYSQYADGNSDSQNAGSNSYFQNAGANSYSQNAAGNSYSQNAGNSYSQNAGRKCLSQDEEESEPIPEPVGYTNPSNIDDFNLIEERCNEVENLNLSIIPENKPSMDMEQEYDSEEEEEVEWDKIAIDMGLLVGGHCNEFESDSNE